MYSYVVGFAFWEGQYQLQWFYTIIQMLLEEMFVLLACMKTSVNLNLDVSLDSLSRKPPIHTRAIIDFNFSSAPVGSEPCVVQLMFENNGAAACQWYYSFYWFYGYLFIYSGYFFIASSSPLPLRVSPDTVRILCRSFMPKRHSQLRVKDLPKVPMWRLEWDSNPWPLGRKVSNLPMSRHASKYLFIFILPVYYSIMCQQWNLFPSSSLIHKFCYITLESQPLLML